jgi:hypothetical protein
MEGIDATYLADIWKAAQVASPFVSMFAIVFWIVRSADARRERRERLKIQTEKDALQELYRNDIKDIQARTLEGLNASAVGSSGTSAGMNAILTSIVAIRDMLLSGNVGTVREVLDRVEAKSAEKV